MSLVNGPCLFSRKTFNICDGILPNEWGLINVGRINEGLNTDARK
jgi:hypothetical protein